MPLIRPGIRRLFRLRLLREQNITSDVNDEVAFHVDLRATQLHRRGMPLEQAREEAWRMFGANSLAIQSLHQTAQHRERIMTIRDHLESLWHDIRYALRGLRRELSFTLFVTLTLALGIGVNSAMYGVVDKLLLRGPAYVKEPDRVKKMFFTVNLPEIGSATSGTVGYVMYDLMRDHAKTFSVAAYGIATEAITFGRGESAERWNTGESTADLFPLLGATPMLGRFFNEEEASPTNPQQVAVLGYNVWKRLFAGDSSIVGKTINLNDQPYTVVGVARKGFTGPDLGPVDVWLPITLRSRNVMRDWRTTWNAQWLYLVTRLAPNATAEQANAEATAIFRSGYTGTEKADREGSISLRPISFNERGDEPAEVPVARWLIGVCAIVLLIACANVVNLLLARTVRRRREIAVRLALGISRARLTRLFVIEGLALAVFGAIAGLAVAYATGTLMRTTLLPSVDWTTSPIDQRVLLISLVIATVVGLVVGMWPAVSFGKPNLVSSLKTGIRDGGNHFTTTRAALTIAQAALSVVLLVGAGLFVRSLSRVRAIDLGIQPDRVLVISPNWGARPRGLSDSARTALNAQRNRTFVLALDRMRQLPAIEHASLTIGLPFNSSFSQRIRIPGWDSIPSFKGGDPQLSAVTRDYFETAGTRLIRGRTFTDADRAGSEPVVIVSQNMAKTFWPGKDPIGSCMYTGSDSTAACARIVGIVSDAKRFRIREAEGMHYYVPFGQETGIGGTSLLVRPRGDASKVIAQVRRAMLDIDPTIRFVSIRTLQAEVDPQVRPWKLGASMFTLMGVLALCVAAFGLYSVISYLVAQRTHEIGVRIALGASAGAVIRLIMRNGVGTALIGCAVGIAIAITCGRFLEPLLFETSALDPTIYGLVTGTLIAVAAIASLIPALKARRVNPMEALRTD